jgi:enoyl-[acyl-carrier protein] reductase / trans-2-enoyl-CoA reductase (NAD+)
VVAKVIRPAGMGFILLDAHPVGCAAIVDEMIAEVQDAPAGAGTEAAAAAGAAETALIIGCSAGYGLAATVAALYGMRARVLGLCFERPATQRRSASAGWYRVAALAGRAHADGLEFDPVNGDCFDPAVRSAVLDRAAAKFGQIGTLIYSVAAPRRADPRTGATYQSAVKPIGAAYSARSLTFGHGKPVAVKEATLEAANDAEIEATVKVMGGEDWADWVADLAGRDLLAPGFRTVALTYLGSDLTAPIYRKGTIGRAKDHLEATAGQLTETVLRESGGRALTSVNGAVVTLSSVAIPGISLYLSLLHEVAGPAAQSPVRQSVRLWDHLSGTPGAELDDQGRLRLDDWEFAAGVQDQLRKRWDDDDAAITAGLSDPDWFGREIERLYGFSVDGVDYTEPVELDVAWPAG